MKTVYPLLSRFFTKEYQDGSEVIYLRFCSLELWKTKFHFTKVQSHLLVLAQLFEVLIA